MSYERRLEPVIRVEGLSRRYGAATVLDRLDLTIGRGEFLTLLGRSGSGKTTLLRILARLDQIEEGKVSVPAQRGGGFPRKPSAAMEAGLGECGFGPAWAGCP